MHKAVNMHVRCPHCHSSIEFVSGETLCDLECPSCGSGFSLVGNLDETDLHDHSNASLGHFQLIRQLGIGAFGSVWEAKDTELDRKVAVKIPRNSQRTVIEDAQFLREARSAAQLSHPNIVPVYEVGRESGQVYIVSELIDGVTLADRLELGPFSARESAQLIATAASAISHAHAAGVIHRDIKPSNIMLDSQGDPHVMDFGLAKRETGEITMTMDGAVLGTPAYMSPEQAKGEAHDADARSDIYSLGVVLFECLSGELPFRGNKRMLLHQVLHEEPPSPRALEGSIPKDLETICLKCLRKDASGRYQTAESLAGDLRRWLHGESIHARPSGWGEKVWLWGRRHPEFVGAICAIITILAVALGAVYERRNAVHADGLINSLLSADIDRVSGIATQIGERRFWTASRVANRFHEARDGSDGKRRLRMAMLQFNDEYVESVANDLVLADLQDTGAIVDALRPHRDKAVPTLWRMTRDSSGAYSSEMRFRATIALAALDPSSSNWDASHDEMLVRKMVRVDPVHQRASLLLLDDLSARLLATLEGVLVDGNRGESERLAAASALAYFARSDVQLLSRLLRKSFGSQYRVLFSAYNRVATNTSQTKLRSLIGLAPSAMLGHDGRIELGRSRALSAITLLRRDSGDQILDALRYDDDPESSSQFAFHCHACGVAPEKLFSLLIGLDQQRGPLGERRSKRDTRALCAVVLALGQYSWDELPGDREDFVRRLDEIYARDPSSSVHSAVGWLLRRWKRFDVVRQVDQSEIAYDPSGHREWFTRAFQATSASDGQPAQFFMTFVVFSAGEFVMGSPEDEPRHQLDEPQHRVRLSRPIAVCDRELTWRQWDLLTRGNRRQESAKQWGVQLSDEDPVHGVSWSDAVRYCQRLSAASGIPDRDQCYKDLPAGDGEDEQWVIDIKRGGYRLPTEAEWEYVCRSGVSTAYSFGNDPKLLARYAWHLDNSGGWSHPVAQLCPNSRGLFDVHGNLSEWCNDWYMNVFKDGDDPVVLTTLEERVMRSGGWGATAATSRSAFRGSLPPGQQSIYVGFRVVQTLPSRSSN